MLMVDTMAVKYPMCEILCVHYAMKEMHSIEGKDLGWRIKMKLLSCDTSSRT